MTKLISEHLKVALYLLSVLACSGCPDLRQTTLFPSVFFLGSFKVEMRGVVVPGTFCFKPVASSRATADPGSECFISVCFLDHCPRAAFQNLALAVMEKPWKKCVPSILKLWAKLRVSDQNRFLIVS